MTLKLFIFAMMIAIISGLTFVDHLGLADDQLKRHNSLRSLHQAPPLTLDANLQRIAQNYANFLASKGLFQHSRTKGLGENLYAISGGSYAAPKATDAWYNQIRFYNFSRGGFSMQTGHFTAVVWKSSTRVGFGYATKGGRTVVVANYSPPGNVQGQFGANVLPKR